MRRWVDRQFEVVTERIQQAQAAGLDVYLTYDALTLPREVVDGSPSTLLCKHRSTMLCPGSDQARTLAIVGIMLAIYGLGLWLPSKIKERKLNEQIANAQRELGFDRASAEGLGQLANEVVELRRIVDSSDKLVPQTSELAALLRELSQQLQKQNVLDQELHTKPLLQGVDYTVIPIDLRFRGSFPALFGFVKEVESMRRLTRINHLEIEGNPANGEPLSAQIELTTFSALSESE